MFRITHGKGFHITFKNGYTISVQFGVGNYTDERTIMDFLDFDTQRANMAKGIFPKSRTAETAIIAPDGNLVEYKGDDVQGYQTPEEVLETMIYVSQIK